MLFPGLNHARVFGKYGPVRTSILYIDVYSKEDHKTNIGLSPDV